MPGSAISHGRYPFGTLGCVVEAEIDAWLKARIAERDGATEAM